MTLRVAVSFVRASDSSVDSFIVLVHGFFGSAFRLRWRTCFHGRSLGGSCHHIESTQRSVPGRVQLLASALVATVHSGVQGVILFLEAWQNTAGNRWTNFKKNANQGMMLARIVAYGIPPV